MAGITDEQFRKILDNNVLANHWLVQLVAPEMVERGAGSIIIVSSVGGLTSSTVIGAYNISKAADFQLVRNLAAEFGPKGVRVNCHRAGPGPHRFRPRAVGKSGYFEARHQRRRAEAHRRAARAGRRGDFPRLAERPASSPARR